jgi:RimJ/RimL family protein N-acetyltransferase
MRDADAAAANGGGPVTLDRHELMASFRSLLPGLPEEFDEDLRIDGAGPLDVTQRSLLRAALNALGGGVPDELLRSIGTIGEALDWLSEIDAAGHRTAVQRSTRDLPGLMTHSIALRPLEPSDMAPLYSASIDPRTSFRWRFRGATPSFQVFNEALYQNVLAQFAVTDRAAGELHGLVSAYDANHDAGWVYIAFQRSSHSDRGGEMIQGMFLLIDYLFRTWPFRKIYAELPEYNYDEILVNMSDLFVLEGRLVGHFYHDERYWDQCITAVDRERWRAFASVWRPILCGAESSAQRAGDPAPGAA